MGKGDERSRRQWRPYAAAGFWLAWAINLLVWHPAPLGLCVAALTCSLSLNALVSIERRRSGSFGPVGRAVFCAMACAGTLLCSFSVAAAGWFGVQYAGYALAGAGCAGAYLTVGPSLGKMTIGNNLRGLPVAAALGALVFLGVSYLPAPWPTMACAAFPLLGLACAGRPTAQVGKYADEGGIASSTALGAPGDGGHRPCMQEGVERTVSNTTFDRWQISVKVSAFWFAFGFIWALGAPEVETGGETLAILCAAFVCFMGAGMYVTLNVMRKSFITTFWAFATVMVLGVAAIAVLGREASLSFFALALAERMFVQIELMIHFAALGHKNGYPCVLLFGRAFGIMCAAEALGFLIGSICEPLMTEWLSVALLCVLCIVILNFMALISQVNTGLHQTELEQAIEHARQDALRQSAAPRESKPEKLAAYLQESYGLSARETQACALLLDSRSASYIAEKLGVSLSTANTHVRHIYAKAGVSGKQELIDLALSLPSGTAADRKERGSA